MYAIEKMPSLIVGFISFQTNQDEVVGEPEEVAEPKSQQENDQELVYSVEDSQHLQQVAQS